jgi:hypothetical protein
VLCGAGISAPVPSSVPSWWGFNETVLDVIRARYVESQPIEPAAATAVDGLRLEQVGIVSFSQVVTDAFAGSTWFRLLRCLDGTTPNAVHRALVALAAKGVLRTIVTTNFDTLLERAAVGVTDVQVLHALVDTPAAVSGDGRPLIVKLHGSATKPTTLVDLATQKARGLPLDWLDWLATLWSRHAVLVLGFSGADTTFGGDYLRLHRSSGATPWLRWNVRAGSAPTPEATAIVALYGDRGGYLTGDLPGVLSEYDINVEPDANDHARRSRRPLALRVGDWLDRSAGDAGACGIVLARMLEQTGEPTAARSMFDGLRTDARQVLAAGVAPAAAARLALVLAQVAHDTADQHPRRAIKDLDLALRAYEAVVDFVGGPAHLPPHARQEWALTMCTLYQSRARAHLNLRQHRAADRWNARAATFFDDMTPLELQSKAYAGAEIAGVAAYYRGDLVQAAVQLRLAGEFALASGRPDHAAAIDRNLHRVKKEAGSSAPV